ncbi:hypothetical protein P5673_025788 [Acropora cervicornis]|uniref:Myb/SANT-like DNA-binding domain-containing protein n=1 Tax=Acropora cervicornis TaxID=6130 RepID=A0AAD9Q1Q5_ACRCE|nr:hypothetical protein P5673_025788 [Acropora cervicornis]
MDRAKTFPFYPRSVSPSDALSNNARTPRRFVIPPVSDHFADPVPAHGPYIFPAFQNQLWLPPARFSRPDSPPESQISPYQSASVIGVGEGRGIENSSKDASTKCRSPNWSDAEVRFLITTWKDRHPIRKRQNSAVWESIAKELNSLLREQGLTSIRTAAQCKAKIKNLEDEYKHVKDHNSKSGNDRESSAYYEELNEILGCRAKITPKTVVECGFIDDNSAIPGPSLEELSESGDDESIRDGEEQTLSEASFRRELAAKKGKKCFATMPNSSKQKGPKSAKSAESEDEDLTFSQSIFFKNKRRSDGNQTGEKATSATQPPAKKKKQKNGIEWQRRIFCLLK